MTIEEKVIERVQKMYAKAQSLKQIGNEAEAEAFMAGVYKTLAAHKLDASVLTIEQQDRTDPMGTQWVNWTKAGMAAKKKRIAWQERLTAAVAQAFFCKLLVSAGSSQVMLVGRKQDRDVAEYMITFLIGTAERLSQSAYWAERHRVHQRTGGWGVGTYKESWLRGFVARMTERLAELNKAEAGTGMALVRVNALALVTDWQAKNLDLKRGTSISGRAANNEGGRAAGRRAADGVSLNRPVRDG